MASRFAALTYIADYWEQNPRIWFSATPDDDRTITTKLEQFITYFSEFDLATLPTADIQQKVGWVILYDQVLKHVNRHRILIEPNFKPYQAPFNLAVQCKKEFGEYYEPDETLTDFQFGFLLMPVRHTHQLGHVKFVLSAAWARLQSHTQNGKPIEFMRNYIKATYTRLAKFIIPCDPESYQDYQPPASEDMHKFITINMCELIDLFDSDKAYLDPQCYVSEGTNPQCYRDNPMNTHMIKQLIKPQPNEVANNKLLTCMSAFMAGIGAGSAPLVVSLSGGVDSMVCSYLLWALDIPFHALHVNYSNRASEICAKEELLIRYWCVLLGVPLRIIRTNEINRPLCMEYGLREVYESYTRDRRFNGYLSLTTQDDVDGLPTIPVRVVLGHNQDDTIENILTNIAGQSHYDNLRGMQPVSTQTHIDREIKFLRPLLGISKREIYEFANARNIPYLVDSTPKWSQRGKIRDIVRPALEAWNPEMLGALQILSDRLADMSATLDALIPAPRVADMSATLDALIPAPTTNHDTFIGNTYQDIHKVPKTQSYWSRIFAGIHVSQKTFREWIAKLEFLCAHPDKLVLNQPVKFTLAKGRNIQVVLTSDKSNRAAKYIKISL